MERGTQNANNLEKCYFSPVNAQSRRRRRSEPRASFIVIRERQKVVVALWAGASADAMKKIYGEALAGSGITLEFDESGPEPAKVRSMVEAGQVSWDVADLSVADCTLLGKAGLVRPIDYGIVSKDSVIPGFAYEFAVASYLFSSIISYDKKALSGAAERLGRLLERREIPRQASHVQAHRRYA